MTKIASIFHKPPSDLAAKLRALADAVEKGDVTDAVIAYIEHDCYDFIWRIAAQLQ
jgi:hypothetical protein